jgi:hypothetical protein
MRSPRVPRTENHDTTLKKSDCPAKASPADKMMTEGWPDLAARAPQAASSSRGWWDGPSFSALTHGPIMSRTRDWH